MNNSIRIWLHGLSAAAIGGSATGLSALLAQSGTLDFKVFAKVAFVGALISAFAYLKQSPLPPTVNQ